MNLAKSLLEQKGLTFNEDVIRAAIEAQVQQLGFDKAAVELPVIPQLEVPAQ
jgi:hypothetical protein